MSSLGFENIFKKYNISCEAPKTSKPLKNRKSDGLKYDLNKNHSCIQLGRKSATSIAGNEVHTRLNLSLPSYHKISKSAKELKTEKMWQAIRAKRRYKPLDLARTKRSTHDCTNTSQSEKGANNDVSPISISNDIVNMDLTNYEEDQSTFLDEKYMNNNLSPILSPNISFQESTNKSYFCHSNSQDLKKKKRNSMSKYLYRHRPLSELSTFRNPNVTNNLDVTNPWKTSLSSLENTPIETFHSCRRNSNKTHQVIDTPTTSSGQFIDQSKELDLLLEFKENNQEILYTSITPSPSPSLGDTESIHCSPAHSITNSQIIDTPTTSSQKSIDQPTELDLLIELIENDNRKITARTKSNGQEISSPKKSCQKGGIEEHFLNVLNRNKIDGRYLKHDKKLGIKSGLPLKVIKLEKAYGINIATVVCIQNNKEFCILIAPEMVAQVKIGSLLESYFDETCDPYSLQTNGKLLDLFIQPYKLLVL